MEVTEAVAKVRIMSLSTASPQGNGTKLFRHFESPLIDQMNSIQKLDRDGPFVQADMRATVSQREGTDECLSPVIHHLLHLL